MHSIFNISSPKPEKVRTCAPLQYNEMCDENGNNNCAFKSITSALHIQRLPAKNENDFAPVDEINKSFKELRIQSSIEKTDWDQRTGQYLAGKINKVIISLNTVLVQPISSDILLHIETPLFLSYTDEQNNEASTYVPLGHVDDIFGSIGEPMYSVRITHNHMARVLNVGEEVYYFPDEPNTQLMHVEQTIGNTFNNVRYNIRIGNYEEYDIYE